MTDHDFGIAQQRGKPLGIALILKDLRVQARFHLAKDARSNIRGEVAENTVSYGLFPVLTLNRCGDRHSFATIHNTVAEAINLSAAAYRPPIPMVATVSCYQGRAELG